jgi:hypothetical protein
MTNHKHLMILFLWLYFISLSVFAADTTPNKFTFIDQTDVPLNTAITSNTITVSGIDTKTTISITGGSFSVNGAAYRTSKTTLLDGATVSIKQTSSKLNNTKKNAVLSIGNLKDTFSVTTVAKDTTPNAFSFIDQTNLPLNTPVMSNSISIIGINAATAITVSGGSYSINGGAFVTKAGTVTNGNTVTVKMTSATTNGTTKNTTLTVGGISDTFSATTIASTNGFVLPPQSEGDSSFSSEHFKGASICATCHDGITDNTNKDVSIQKDWSATMMANSARDPLWKAYVRSEINRAPHLVDVISDKCTRCHAPMANFEAKSYNEPKSILAADGGFLNASNPRHDEAMSGVGCTLCHQIQNTPNLGTLSSFTGKYEIGNDKKIYGQYMNPFANPMIMQTGYTPTGSSHMESSKLCSTCHNLKTPFVDQSGNLLSTTPESEFPEQMPYSEWEHSDHAKTATLKTCQNCHMPLSNGVKIATTPRNLGTRNNFGKHDFVGANKLMLDIFNNNKTQLGVVAATADFNETIDKTQTMLNSSATIDRVSQSLDSDNNLNITLKINSATGHKLPSSYPSRRVVLHVTVKDATNNVVFESGKVNANGSIVGVDADENRTTFEPHYDLITSPEQVQVYEAIMGNNLNEVTYTLLRGIVYLKDNRILPTGFNKATAPNDIKVVGDAFNDANFVGGSDQITYRIPNLTGSNYTVEAELVHQPLAYSFAQDLFSEPSDEGDDFKTMFNASSSKTSRIALNTFSVVR